MSHTSAPLDVLECPVEVGGLGHSRNLWVKFIFSVFDSLEYCQDKPVVGPRENGIVGAGRLVSFLTILTWEYGAG